MMKYPRREFTSSCVLMSNADFLDFVERNHFVMRSFVFENLEKKLGLGDVRDAFSDELAARRPDDEHHVFLGLAGNNTEKSRHFGFKKAPIEAELAPLENNRRGQSGWGRRRCFG